MLGALLDLTAAVLRELPKVKLASLPRMADFARVLAAIARVLGTEALKTYLGLGQRLAADVIDSDPVAIAVREHVIQCQSWEGSAGELLKLLTPVDKPAPRGWPTTPQGMGAALKRAAPDLRAVGIDVEQKPREADRRTWTLTKQASEETGEDPGAGRRARSEDSPENLSHMSQRHKNALTSGNAVTFPVTFEDLGTRTSHPNVTPSQPADLRKHLCSADCDDRDDQNGLPSTDPTTATTATPATSPLVVAFAPPPEPCEVCRQPCTVTSDGRRAHPSCARFA